MAWVENHYSYSRVNNQWIKDQSKRVYPGEQQRYFSGKDDVRITILTRDVALVTLFERQMRVVFGVVDDPKVLQRNLAEFIDYRVERENIDISYRNGQGLRRVVFEWNEHTTRNL
jgi:hypothetical protein